MPQFDFATFPELILVFLIWFICIYVFFLKFYIVPFFEMFKFRKKIYNLTSFSNIDLENYSKTIYSKFLK
jgi:hypothetical protein